MDKQQPVLYIFGGLPGTGKSALARELARERQAVYLRIDTLEQAMREDGILVDGPQGYRVAYALAADNLRLGLSVVADSVNPLSITRTAWRDAAAQGGASFVEIEVICSDPVEHKARVETRQPEVPGLRLPTWEEVANRLYEAWDTDHIQVDTAGQTLAHSLAQLRQSLKPL